MPLRRRRPPAPSFALWSSCSVPHSVLVPVLRSARDYPRERRNKEKRISGYGGSGRCCGRRKCASSRIRTSPPLHRPGLSARAPASRPARGGRRRRRCSSTSLVRRRLLDDATHGYAGERLRHLPPPSTSLYPFPALCDLSLLCFRELAPSVRSREGLRVEELASRAAFARRLVTLFRDLWV